MISWIYRSPIQTTNYQLLVKRDDLQANTLDIDGQDKMTTLDSCSECKKGLSYAALGPDFSERSRFLEAQSAHCETALLSREDEGRLENLSTFPKLVRAVCGPVIGVLPAPLA